ncbi:oligosaccharide flippase family protein [Methylobacterium sp. SD21]|uniref:oligosaccharide flippase family protein n=1 Tax=Methylobacterium litchii TaxID=3138810 RepID=UPI00313E3D84
MRDGHDDDRRDRRAGDSADIPASDSGPELPPDSATRTGAVGVQIGLKVGAKPEGETRRLAANILAGGGVNVIKIALQLVMLPLMANLLGPSEFGVYALALPTVVFFMTLADGGLGASLARESTDSEEVWSTAFWLVLAVGIGLGGILTVWGLVLAQLSHQPRVAGVMAVLAISPIFVTSSVLPVARLTRDRNLVAISKADLAGNLVGAAVGVGLALAGAGAMSLAAQYVVIFFVRTCILNLVAFRCPCFVFKPSVLKSHISTGSSLVCQRLADFSGRLVENLLFSRLFGAAALGTYTFANQVPRFVCEAASGPVWGALYAHALREDDQQIGQLHAKLVHLLALLLAPVAFLASATVPGLVNLVLGPAWTNAATILSILIPFYALNAITAQCSAILLARGSGWTNFWLSVVQVCARIAAIPLGLWFGSVGIAWGIAAALFLGSMLATLALKRIRISSITALIKNMIAPTAAGILAGLACNWVVQWAPGDVLRIALALIAGGVTYLVALFILEGRRLKEDLVGMRRLLHQ